jgi:CRP/FNR family transcriptional regulator
MMPSAQQKELEPALETADRKEADLHGLLREIHAAKISNLNSVHLRGTILFAEGETSRGVYMLRSGRATVSISSSEGRVVMLRVAQAGDVLGLNSVLQNAPYDTTVKTLELCRTDFISRADLMDLVQQSEAGAKVILNLVSQELGELTNRAKLLLLPQTVIGRLAKLLLEWTKTNGSDGAEVARLDRAFTHEELAQMICSSRETVTRLLTTLTKESIIRVTPGSILIRDRLALEKMAHGDNGHIKGDR